MFSSDFFHSPILCWLSGSNLGDINLLAIVDTLLELSSSGIENIAGGVQSSLNGVLNNADDEADCYDLHGDIIGDTEEGAGHRDEEQGAAGNTGSTAGTEGGQDGEDDSGGQVDDDAHGVGGSQSHDSDGDSCTVHVDGSAERNGYGVVVFVQTELLAEVHVDRNVCCGGTGEEGGETALTDAAENEWIGILLQGHGYDERIEDESHDEHTADEDEEKLAVVGEDAHAAGGNRIIDKTHDTERSEADDPADSLTDGFGDFPHHVGSRLTGVFLQSQTDDDSPDEDADLVGIDERAYRVGHSILHQSDEDFADTGRSSLLYGIGELEAYREEEAGNNGNESSGQGADSVVADDGLEAGTDTVTALAAEGADDQHEYENGSDGLQGTYEEGAEEKYNGQTVGDHDAKSGTDDETAGDAEYQIDGIPRFE